MTKSLLTRREIQVLHGVANGMTDDLIACELCICRKTVINYVASILAKLECHTRAQAVFVATLNGWIHAGVTNKLAEIEVES